MSRPARPATERFWEKVDKSRGPNACWLWTGARSDTGYGNFWSGDKTVLAHRYAYQQATGDQAVGRPIDHTCFRLTCVNPAHLRAVTHKQNCEHLQGASGNSKSGVRGVYWHSQRRKWRVSVGHNGRTLYGGSFDSLADADAAATSLRAALFSHDDYKPEPADLEDDRLGKQIARAAEYDASDPCD